MGKCIEYPIKIVQGVDFVWPITFLQSDKITPRDLRGYTALMKIRKTTSDSEVIQELSTENAKITITGLEGQVLVTIPASLTAGYDYPMCGVYSLLLISGITVKERPLYGPVYFVQDPSRT